MYRIVDSGNVAVVLYRSGGISRTSGDPRIDPVGRFYRENVGHYVVKSSTIDHAPGVHGSDRFEDYRLEAVDIQIEGDIRVGRGIRYTV